MKPQTRRRLNDLIETYQRTTEVMEHGAAKAVKEDGRAYGGFIRATKGKLQEFISNDLVQVAWNVELAKDPKRLSINSDKIRIPIKPEYIQTIRNRAIKDYILTNIPRYYYGLSVDKHVFIDGKMLLGIECKAYTENAMLKRILVDFHLLKTKVPNLLCYLFQLESQLGGDYSSEINNPKGSYPTHTLMSYFPGLDLRVITLLPGERKVDQPINKAKHFKALTIDRLEVAVESIIEGFCECKVA
ncbi:MAG: restriction endonuclease [Verrucomicrobia bacterium]|nr:restriction endonuclease [Verrucomicrobiota bacterium]